MSNTIRPWTWLHRAVLPAAGMGLLIVAGCSSGGSGGGTGGSSGSGASAGNGAAASAATTVMISDASGKTVLTNSAGRTLYDNDQENGTVLCLSSACRAIWVPLTVAAGETPTAPGQFTGTLSTIMGAGGKTQVALDGKPLYTFAFDHAAGELNGETSDSFSDGKFTWHAATAAGAAAPAPSAPASSAATTGGYTY